MRNLLSIVLLSSVCFLHAEAVQTVQHVQTGTVDQFLAGFLSISNSKCRNRDDAEAKKFESEGKLAEAHSFRGGVVMVCECMPKRVRNLQSSLSNAEKSRVISDVEFSRAYLPQIVNACGAEQLRATYSGDCAVRFAKSRSNTQSYCSCMLNKLQQISESEISEFGKASADYMPLAANAKKRGLPPPEKPGALKRFEAMDSSCNKP